MLYITTRNNKDTYTSHIALTADTAPDGGRYIPFRIPRFTREEISAFKHSSYNQTVADILNLFFSSRLSAWDVDFCIGKKPARSVAMNHRIIITELWHNADAKFSYAVEQLYTRVCGISADKAIPVDWFKTAAAIAMLFGVYGHLLAEGMLADSSQFDVSVSAEQFLMPMAVWYAREMGLPVNTVICTCDESDNLWDLNNRGTFNCSGASDTLLLGLEKLIHCTVGISEVQRFIQCCTNGRVYSVNEELFSILSKGVFCAVTGKNRAATTINSVYRSNSYVIDPPTALCYAGLQDYRSGTGDSRVTLLLSQRSPLDYRKEISAATGIPEQDIIEHVKL